MQVPTRGSGPSGDHVSALALGSWHTWDRVGFDDVVTTLATALDAGVTLFDVGIYGPLTKGEEATDAIFARAMARTGASRGNYRLAVKGWLPSDPTQPAHLRRQVEQLLDRQSTDHADYLVLGDLMHDLQDFSPLLEQIEDLRGEGLVRHWCVNNWSADQVRRIRAQALAAGLPSLEYAQHKYGITRHSVAEGEPFRTLSQETGLTLQASDTFEGGLIFETTTSRMIGGDIGAIQSRVRRARPRLAQVAADLDTTVAALAIAYPLTNPHTSSVLIGSRTPAQTAANLGAFELLRRCSAAEIRAACQEFWFDRDTIDPDAGWGTTPEDDPATYVTETR